MNVYLPIAEMSVNIFVILGLGGVTGILSGMFGIGGGFLITPLLMFIGVPPAVSVSTAANQIIASSVSGFIAHWRRDNVDFKMGGFLLAGGAVGSTLGVALFRWLKQSGHIDLIISVSYVTFLGIVGSMMVGDFLRVLFKSPKKTVAPTTRPSITARLPWKIEFPKSKIQVSAVVPVAIGFFIGILVSLMGIGGGFLLVPAMIYLLNMPTNVVIGTSLFQVIFITCNVTFLHAVTTQTVDVLLALLLLSGAVVGAQFGSKLAVKLPGEILRGLLAMLVMAVAIKLAFGLFAPPSEIYTVIVTDE